MKEIINLLKPCGDTLTILLLKFLPNFFGLPAFVDDDRVTLWFSPWFILAPVWVFSQVSPPYAFPCPTQLILGSGSGFWEFHNLN